jgi:hypothetical protein
MNDCEILTVEESLGVVEVWSGETLLNVLRPTTDILQVTTVGPQGPQGDQGLLGPVGVPGPQGPQGDPGTPSPQFDQTFNTPSVEWTIVHNLDAYPVVSLYDLYGFAISGDVSMPDRNTVVVDFAVPFAGTARLKA